jgi:ankyrin repeat protein
MTFLRNDTLALATTQAALDKANKYRDYSKQYSGGTNGLHLAARYGLTNLVERLLQQAAYTSRADSKDHRGRTSLSWAAGEGHEEVVRLLVERDDVEADSKDDNDRTPLSWAAENGHEATVRLLVERDDVEANLEDEYGKTPLSYETGT